MPISLVILIIGIQDLYTSKYKYTITLLIIIYIKAGGGGGGGGGRKRLPIIKNVVPVIIIVCFLCYSYTVDREIFVIKNFSLTIFPDENARNIL